MSAIGPYASVASVMPNVESIPTAASAIPYKPKFPSVNPPDAPNATRIAIATIIIGNAVDIIPRPIPPIIIVAEPVSAFDARFFVGL